MGHGPHLKGKSMNIDNIIKQTVEDFAKIQKRSASSIAARYSAFAAQLRNVAIREMAKEDFAKLEQEECAADGGKVISASTGKEIKKGDRIVGTATEIGAAFHKAAEGVLREAKANSTTGYIMVPSSFTSVSQREAYIEGLDKEIACLESVNKELYAAIDRNHQSVSLLVGRKVMANHTPTEGRESGCNAWETPKLR